MKEMTMLCTTVKAKIGERMHRVKCTVYIEDIILYYSLDQSY